MTGATIGLGDAATWFGAAIAIFAALFTWQQAHVAKQQLTDSRTAAIEDDDRRRKNLAVVLGQDWCRTEAPSPIAILRECLIACDTQTLAALLDGQAISLPFAYQSEIRTFFDEVLRGRAEGENWRSTPNGVVNISQGYAHLIRNFFARRLNFFEIVAAAFNSHLADENLIEQFFGRILDTNDSYKAAIRLNPRGWPELAKFCNRARLGAP
jgi:hypothetical protein